MKTKAVDSERKRSELAVASRHARPRHPGRRTQIAASRLSLGTLQALMGLAAYQARLR